jgi:hypothetical protein
MGFFRAFSSIIVLATIAGAVQAHGGGDESIRVSLDAVPAALHDVHVSVRKTLGQQLVVQHAGSSPLEVLGTDGVAFLRIGSDGVFANVNAVDWYRFYSMGGGVPLPTRLTEKAGRNKLAADWRMVSRDPAWGWFDTRIDTEAMKVPHSVQHADRPTAFKAWRIPVRLGQRQFFLQGHFDYVPLPNGSFEASLTSPAEVAPGVFLQVMQGPIPGIMINNTAAETVTVLDRKEQPFLEVTPSSVRANTRSSAWIDSGLAPSSTTPINIEQGDAPNWLIRSATPRLTWLEPRATASGDALHLAENYTPSRTNHPWVIPLMVNGKRIEATGVTRWVKFAADKTLSASK